MSKIARFSRRRHSPDAEGSEYTPMPDFPGPTGNSAANLLLADIAVRTGSGLLRKAVERVMLRSAVGSENAGTISRKRNLPQKAATVVISRIGTSSVPGAALVGIGLAAATIYQRRRAERFERAMRKLHLLGKGEGKPPSGT
jgi:hypothetical protein